MQIGISLSSQQLDLCLLSPNSPDAGISSPTGQSPPVASYFSLPDWRHNLGHFLRNNRALKRQLQKHPLCLSLSDPLVPPTLIDLPKAENDEQLRNLIIYHSQELLALEAQDMVLDFTALPKEAWRGQKTQGFVCAEHRDRVQQLWQDFSQHGIELKWIESLEFSLGRFARQFSHHQTQAHLIALEQHLLLQIYHQNQLSLQRHLNFNLGFQHSLASQHLLDALILELQRSFDFFEHHMALSEVTAMSFISPIPLSPHLADQLADQIRPRLNTQVLTTDQESAQQSKDWWRQWAAQGAAMRVSP